jgi:hypothetical protein
MATAYKNPPNFDDQRDNYEVWKNELEIWQRVTDLEKKKQALAVTLTLRGQARTKALEIKAETLNTEDGMSELLNALDSIFQKDKVDIAYNTPISMDTSEKEKTCLVTL